MDKNETNPAICVYGNEVRNNIVDGPAPDARAAGIILGVETAAERTAGAAGNIIEGNEVHDLQVAIRLGTNVADTRIRANRCFLRGADSVEIQRGGPL